MKFRLSSVAAISCAVAMGTLLFWTSQKVQTAETRLRQLKTAVASEENTIRVLRAEWAYLTRPDRLENLARTYLGMKPVSPDQVSGTPDIIPTPAQPGVPGRKPMRAQPVAASTPDAVSPASEAAQPALPQPPEKPADDRPQRSFRDLLDDVGKKGAP